jgi:hypothetical protein
MRLPKELIKHIADAIAMELESKAMVKYSVKKTVISTAVAEVITENVLAEDKLNKEVERLLSAHEADIAKGHMDYRKVFELTKQKLAKERGMVL